MAQTQHADVIFLNGDIYTGADGSRVQALAVREGRIVAGGTNAEIEEHKGSATQVVDLGGRFVMPGFNDAHLHLASGGFEKLNVDLVGAKSLEEMTTRIAARARQTPAGEWLTGRGWDHTLWPGKRLPTRADIDKVAPGHPAFFNRVDGHIAIANSAALKAAGITRETRDPEGGQIDRDAKGEPTGILRETAMRLVSAHIPAPSPAQRRRAMELALAEAARWGVTSAQDNSQWADFLVLEELQREGKLTLRVTEWLDFGDRLELLRTRRAHHRPGDLMLRTGMLKGFMDGSLGSRTAALLADYADGGGNRGLPRYPQDELNAMTRERVESGFQIGFHAIGDAGAEMALDAFQQAERALREKRAGERPELRLRIEHAQVVAPEQFERFRRLGVIASMQPNHLLTDMNWARERIGPERAKTSYPWKQFLQSRVSLAFGTDFPVEPITPFRGLYAAVTRKNEAGTAEYVPEQKLSIHEAIAAYTVGSAHAEFAEKDKGTLEPGKLADFVVLDRDITKVAPEEILQTKVLRTVVGGKTVYQAQ